MNYDDGSAGLSLLHFCPACGFKGARGRFEVYCSVFRIDSLRLSVWG